MISDPQASRRVSPPGWCPQTDHTLVSYGGTPRGNIRVVHGVQFVLPANTNGSSAQITTPRSVVNRLEGLVRANRVEVRVLFGAL